MNNKETLTEEQKQNYHSYIIRNIIGKFEGRPINEVRTFLKMATDIAEQLAFTTAQGREIDLTVPHLIK